MRPYWVTLCWLLHLSPKSICISVKPQFIHLNCLEWYFQEPYISLFSAGWSIKVLCVFTGRPHKVNALFGRTVKHRGSYWAVTKVTRCGIWDKPERLCFFIGTIPAYINILYNMFITSFGIKRLFNGWDAYVFLHIGKCALKKEHSVFLSKWAHQILAAVDLFVL